MKKLLLGLTLLVSMTSFASTNLACKNANDEPVGEISFTGPFEEQFTSKRCVKYDRSRECIIPSHPDDEGYECPCLESETTTHLYNSWRVSGSLKVSDLEVSINTNAKQYSDGPRISGTQSGQVGNTKYTLNFWSNMGFDIEGDSITAVLLYNSKRVNINCSRFQ